MTIVERAKNIQRRDVGEGITKGSAVFWNHIQIAGTCFNKREKT